MPTVVRIPGKATKIAYKILGKPSNLSYKPTAKQKWINRRLEFEETARVR